jgi:hypothetical protein
MAKMTMRALSVALVAIVVTAGAAEAAVPPDRYGFAHGCYALETWEGSPIAPESGPFRMQATDLGTYLLYGVHEDFLSDPGTGIPTPTAAPSTAAEWDVTGSPGAYAVTNKATGYEYQEVTFLSETGCANYPEATTGAYGRHPRAAPRNTAPVYGFADAHLHWTGFRLFGSSWHCGRPFHKYGIPYAMPDCAQYDRGPNGEINTNGQVRAFIDGRVPGQPYDSVGWPTFNYWPGPSRQAEEGTYYTSMERAWLGGLRLATVLFVDNEGLCDAMTTRDPSPPTFCNDMNSVRQQSQDLEDFQDYIDAQNGGPGKGFMRIVTTPAQARRVINQGKLAVIKGVELSRILNCGETVESDPEPGCTEASIDAGLDELWNLGIRDFFPVHKFDNAFGGTKMDHGAIGFDPNPNDPPNDPDDFKRDPIGPVVNAGNHYKTHHFWNVGPCSGPGEDETQPTVPIAANVAQLIYDLGLLPPATSVPVYGPPPHCNQRGLTAIGAYVINKMIDRHFLIEIDHMDELTAGATMDIVEACQYPGVVNSHGGWSSDPTIARMKAVGGAVGFNKSASSGTGLGSDINGLSSQPGLGSTQIEYPFRSRDRRVTFNRETYGQRTFDLNTDGVATYGLWIDWMEMLRREGREDRLRAMFHSAEDYLETWGAAKRHVSSGC